MTDNCDTPDTVHVTFEYPKFLVTYESRTCNSLPLFGLNQGVGTSIHGTEGTMLVNRRGVWVIPNAGSRLSGATWENIPDMMPMNLPHWKNFVECVRSRQKPTSDIETCVRSSAAGPANNAALVSRIEDLAQLGVSDEVRVVRLVDCQGAPGRLLQ